MDIVSILESTLSNDIRKLDVVAQNLANLNTVGFKKTSMTQSFDRYLSGNDQQHLGGSLIPTKSISTDFSASSPKDTGGRLDFAIEGNGFFEIRGKEGVFYTRNGQFSVSPDGFLETAKGYRVMSESGEIYVGTESIKIGHDLQIEVGEEVLGRLKLVDFSSPQNLLAMGAGLYKGSDDGSAATDSSVLQGYLETSNVNTVDEIVQMMSLTRHFETAHVALKSYDNVLDIVINKIGEA